MATDGAAVSDANEQVVTAALLNPVRCRVHPRAALQQIGQAEAILADKEWAAISQQKIADHVGCSAAAVSDVKSSLKRLIDKPETQKVNRIDDAPKPLQPSRMLMAKRRSLPACLY